MKNTKQKARHVVTGFCFGGGQEIRSVCGSRISLREPLFARLLRPLHRFSLAVSSAGRARSKRSRRGTRHSARIHMRSKSNNPYANAYGLLLAEDKRFEIRLRRFTLFHQAPKSQVSSHFFSFTFHEFSQHFTKIKDT